LATEDKKGVCDFYNGSEEKPIKFATFLGKILKSLQVLAIHEHITGFKK
jgi:hypothetical protein